MCRLVFSLVKLLVCCIVGKIQFCRARYNRINLADWFCQRNGKYETDYRRDDNCEHCAYKYHICIPARLSMKL